MNDGDVTVVVPAFNAKQTIEETLCSIASQTRPAARVVVVDDGSTDGTAALASSHRLHPDVLTKSNGGAASAFNLGIRSAETPLVAFLDADDLWAPDKLELQAATMHRLSELDMVLGHYKNFVCPTVSVEDAKRLPHDRDPRPGYLIGCLLVRRESFLRVGELDPKLKTGYFIDWWSRAMDVGLKFSMPEDLVLCRRLRPNSLSFRSRHGFDQIGVDALAVARASILRRRR